MNSRQRRKLAAERHNAERERKKNEPQRTAQNPRRAAAARALIAEALVMHEGAKR